MRSYSLDAHDLILSVTGDWDAFALQNRGQAAVASRVAGRYLWDFVTGTETRAHLTQLFHVCRRGGEAVTTTYRCDSPEQERLFRMEICPGGPGAIRLSHHLLRERPRALVPLRDFAGVARFWRCSQCKFCNPGRQWVDHRHFAPPAGAAEIDVICRACRAAALHPVPLAADGGPLVA